LKEQHYNERGLGYADFFQGRHKWILMRLARIKPSDTFYDLGCGDGSVLIFAAREFGIKEGVGFEDNPVRQGQAKKLVRAAGLSNKITISGDMRDADLSEANVILMMLPESEDDYEMLVENGIKKGTRLLRHDLPLIGFLPDAIDIPFYKLVYPFKRAKTPQKWAEGVLQEKGATIRDVWKELYYYSYEKGYSKWDLKRFDRILSKRMDELRNEN